MIKQAKYPMGFLAFCSLLLLTTALPTESQATTKGGIHFFPDDSIEKPVDPKDPDRPIEPKEPPTGGTVGLSYASPLVFGDHALSSKGQEYFALLDKVKGTEDHQEKAVPNFVQLTDKSGTNQGWELTVTQSAPLTNEKGFALENARFVFRNPVGIGTLKEAKAPSFPTKELAVTAVNQPVLVARADKDAGQGTWTVQFGQNEEEGRKGISLYIPGETKKQAGSYKTTLVWSLTSGI